MLGIKARLLIIYLNERQIAEMIFQQAAQIARVISHEIEKPVGGILKFIH